MPNRSRQRCPSWQRAPFETAQSEHSYRPRSHTPCRSAWASFPLNPGAPITPHHVPPSSSPPTSGIGRVYKRESISRFSFYAGASPRHAGSTLGMHRQARQSGNPFHGSASLQASPPHDTPPQLCAHGLTTSNRRTSSRLVYRVFWHTYELIGLGGPARLYQAVGHIGTRPFYETPGVILLKVDSFGHAKRSSRGHYVSIVTWPPDTTLGGALSCVHT